MSTLSYRGGQTTYYFFSTKSESVFMHEMAVPLERASQSRVTLGDETACIKGRKLAIYSSKTAPVCNKKCVRRG